MSCALQSQCGVIGMRKYNSQNCVSFLHPPSLLFDPVVAPDYRPLTCGAVGQEYAQADVAKLHEVPCPVLLSLFPLIVREGRRHVGKTVMGVARSVVGAVGSFVPSAEVHCATFHLAAPIYGWFAVFLGRSHRLLLLFPLQKHTLPLLVLGDCFFERRIFSIHLPLFVTFWHLGPDFVLVTWNHGVQHTTSTGAADV